MTQVTTIRGPKANAVRLFHVDIPDEALDDLRRRIADTRWPEKETVGNQSQGVPLAMIEELARYWMTSPELFTTGVRSAFKSLRNERRPP